MLKNICNYSAILLLSLVVLAGPVAANPHETEPIEITGGSFNFYDKFLLGKTSQSYRVKVAEGKGTNITIRSGEGVAVTIYLPSGEIKEYKNEKYFNLKLHAAGEYVIKLNSPYFSKYTMQGSVR